MNQFPLDSMVQVRCFFQDWVDSPKAPPHWVSECEQQIWCFWLSRPFYGHPQCSCYPSLCAWTKSGPSPSTSTFQSSYYFHFTQLPTTSADFPATTRRLYDVIITGQTQSCSSPSDDFRRFSHDHSSPASPLS